MSYFEINVQLNIAAFQCYQSRDFTLDIISFSYQRQNGANLLIDDNKYFLVVMYSPRLLDKLSLNAAANVPTPNSFRKPIFCCTHYTKTI